MRLSFAHHLSLSYGGGGEKWLAQLSTELVRRGHEVSIRCLPFSLGRKGVKPSLEGVDYREGYYHSIKDSDLTYVTYNPLSWLNFKIEGPRIAGLHSACYWQPVSRGMGILPNIANVANKFFSDLDGYEAVHSVTEAFPVNHDNLYVIPNFVDAEIYRPCSSKNEEFTVGYASRKTWSKGYDIFLELKAIMDGFHFVETMNIPESKMPEYHSRNHVTLVPSRVGTFDLVNVESLLCGTPVISSGLEAHRQLRLPLSYAGSIEDYIDRITDLMNQYESGFYSELSSSGRNYAMKYDKDLIIDRLEELFIEVALC